MRNFLLLVAAAALAACGKEEGVAPADSIAGDLQKASAQTNADTGEWKPKTGGARKADPKARPKGGD